MRVKCPSCQARLFVRGPDSVKQFTCPKCLAQVQSSDLTAFQRGEPAPQAEESCPSCDERIQPHWDYCPVCDERLKGDDLGLPRYRRPEIDIRRDQRRTSVGLIVMAAFGGVHLIMILWSVLLGISANANTRDAPQVLFWIFAYVGFFFLVGSAIAWLRSRSDPQARGANRLLVGSLLWSMALMGGMMVLLLALLVFFFVVCIAIIAGAGSM